jgi:methionine-S-sulfoxide reductase
MKTEKAAFAAGCFWGVQKAFDETKGVINTEVGFMGGNTKNPSYEDVCRHETGHAETVMVEFDPKVISFEKLLGIFWKIHDPTQHNRQGLNFGSQYRSIIFYYADGQKEAAEKSMRSQQKKYNGPIATQIIQASTFWKAEEHHQKYYKTHPNVC